VLDGTGQALQVQRNQPEYTVRVNFNEPLAKGKAATLIFDYDGRLNGTEESPVYGVRFASIQADYAYLLYPARWFPVNEYTADRFAATLKIGVPTGYKVVASGLDSKPAISDGKSIFEFDSQRPSFPGSVAIVKGEAYRGSQSGVTTQVYFRGEKVRGRRCSHHRNGEGDDLPHADLRNRASSQSNPRRNRSRRTQRVCRAGHSLPEHERDHQPGQLAASGQSNSPPMVGPHVSPTTRNHTWLSNAGARYAEMLWVEKNRARPRTNPK
jgi:hypothetical protein